MSQLRDDAIAAYCAELHDLEDEVERAQEDKKKFFENARDAHGRKFVAALKLAIKTARMDPDKRLQVEEIDAEAERILGIMRQGLHVARGARTREDVPEHDAETGEIIEPQPLAAQTVPAQPAAKSPAEGDAVETSAPIPDAADALRATSASAA